MPVGSGYVASHAIDSYLYRVEKKRAIMSQLNCLLLLLTVSYQLVGCSVLPNPLHVWNNTTHTHGENKTELKNNQTTDGYTVHSDQSGDLSNNETKLSLLIQPEHEIHENNKYTSPGTAELGDQEQHNDNTHHRSSSTEDEPGEHEAVWQQIKQICGYYRMCSKKKTYFGYSMLPTCCPRCNCHPSCTLSHNCCPDADIDTGHTDVATACMSLYDILMQAMVPQTIVTQQSSEEHDKAAEGLESLALKTVTDSVITDFTDYWKSYTMETSTAIPQTEEGDGIEEEKEVIDDSEETNEDKRQETTEEKPWQNIAIHDETSTMKPVKGQLESDTEISTNPVLQLDQNSTATTESLQATADKNKTITTDDNNTDTSMNLTNSLQGPSKPNGLLGPSKLFARYMVVSSCPAHYTNPGVAYKCTSTHSQFTRDHIPIIDMVDITIYKNVYCAMCHSINGFVPMDIVTNCTRLYLLDHVPVYLQDFKEVTQGCLAYIDPTTNLQAEGQLCNNHDEEMRLGGSETISRCNVTGVWDSYDAYVEGMCKNSDHMAMYKDTEERGGSRYKNIYCNLCNRRQEEKEKDTCNINKLDTRREPDGLFAGFRAYLSVAVPCHGDPGKVPQGLDSPTTEEYQGHKGCRHGYIPDMYTLNCRRFLCPVHETPIYNLCLRKSSKVKGLVLVGKVQVELNTSSVLTMAENQLPGPQAISVIQRRIADYFQLDKQGCNRLQGKVYGQIQDGLYSTQLTIMFKIQNTDNCSVQSIIGMYSRIANEKVDLHPNKNEGNTVPKITIKMTYGKLDTENMTLLSTGVPADSRAMFSVPIQPLSSHEILLNASFHCPRVMLTVPGYESLLEAGQLAPLPPHILQQEYTQDTGLLEVCLSDYLQHWLVTAYSKSGPAPSPRPSLEVTLSAIATIVSMLSITIVIITFCLFSELRFIPGKLAMILCINLLLAQAFFAFGLDLGVDNTWCKLMGMCIHVFWLATIFSMNSILLLMLRSLHKPLHVDNRIIIQSRSTAEILKYILHCYFMPLVCVLVNALSSSLNITDEFGYGGKLCYIRTARMRIYTFAVPLGTIMLANFILFALIMYSLSTYMKTANEKIPVKQIYIFFKLITMTGMYWLFGFLYELTELHIFAYLFTVLNAGQGFFLMWTFLHNSHVCHLYKNAFAKYMKRFRSSFSQSYSLS